ncbi:MAG: MarR family transcriptional regulator [Actinomycetia bacterium]|nr:MarR family transcriptional regulator [Actinomycetes bacterium]
MPRLDAERIELWRQLCTTSTVLQRRIEQSLHDEHDLTLAWYDALTAIRHAGGSMRVHELCAALSEVPSSLSRRLDRLEEEGFVWRKSTPMPDDRRAVTVSLTREGRNAWRDATTTYRSVVQTHFARHLTESDIAALQRVWAKLGE